MRGWVGAVLRGGNWRFGDPESVAQEILVELFGIVRAGRVQDPGSFQKLVYSVAKNTCVDVYHRERRRDRILAPEPDPANEPALPEVQGPHADLERREMDRILQYVLQRIPQGCRDLLAWVYGEGVDSAEAALRLGIRAGAARVRVHRCLERAREIYRARTGTA